MTSLRRSYNALKRLTTLWTLLFELLVLGRRLNYVQVCRQKKRILY
jgi:hypothetical protein